MTRSLDEDSDSDLVDCFGVIVLTPSNSSEPSSKHATLMDQWNEYFKKGTLQDFQRLCVDLGLPNDLPSKTKCRDALKSISVNIKQFLQCENRPDDVKLFKNRKELIVWTRKRKDFFPRHQLPKGSPLRTLLKHMFN
ncbi:uncharacterized protein FFB20_06163 [Fusarium fujikuroi]|uniref:Uncharacterized protein n=2 Tax=Fusarium fujikuroi TaxID=5127 RepID=S0DPF8_GIBF5|nr:uncharacterized protein FFUJ_01003 [Fusarium fujikuroi IMI 58289]KLO96255.1 uncharacterized protein LW93_2246 [Fusarium fujikuroi]KLO97625.1 uncharacterized protein LW94_674 [Fusarium fujikuroi]KLP06544.1 uncharacterized protein Y057_9185 [Fusarium fujikuroi]QGI58909.1 hypothetical protein CEK27_001034 [Fusarium fujikuroi]QGI76124.1 hypothetical protein CEK25_001030 [Fusarium fujikuroi]